MKNKEKAFWTTKDKRRLDIDEITDIYHLRNIIKHLLKERELEEYRDIGDYQDTF